MVSVQRASVVRCAGGVEARPGWYRYHREPQALYGIIAGHLREMRDDPARAHEYEAEIAEIKAHLRREFGEW